MDTSQNNNAEYISEGITNMKIDNSFKEAKEKYKESIKDAKKLAKEGKYEDAIKYIKDGITENEKIDKYIRSLKTEKADIDAKKRVWNMILNINSDIPQGGSAWAIGKDNTLDYEFAHATEKILKKLKDLEGLEGYDNYNKKKLSVLLWLQKHREYLKKYINKFEKMIEKEKETTKEESMETRFSLLYTAINEKFANEEITLAQAEMLKEEAFNKYVLADDEEYISEDATEKVKEVVSKAKTSKLVTLKKKLKEIRDKKPKEYDGPEEIKKFVDDYYDDIMKASSVMEKEPENLRKDDVKGLVSVIIGSLGKSMAVAGNAIKRKAKFANFGYGDPVAKVGGGIMAVIGLFTMFIVPGIWVVLRWVRNNADIENINYLTKIKGALKSVDTKGLPEKYKNKISDMITAVNDAETSVRAKLKVTKESTANMTDTLLSIYEAAADNSISSEEKDFLISTLRQ